MCAYARKHSSAFSLYRKRRYSFLFSDFVLVYVSIQGTPKTLNRRVNSVNLGCISLVLTPRHTYFCCRCFYQVLLCRIYTRTCASMHWILDTRSNWLKCLVNFIVFITGQVSFHKYCGTGWCNVISVCIYNHLLYAFPVRRTYDFCSCIVKRSLKGARCKYIIADTFLRFCSVGQASEITNNHE